MLCSIVDSTKVRVFKTLLHFYLVINIQQLLFATNIVISVISLNYKLKNKKIVLFFRNIPIEYLSTKIHIYFLSRTLHTLAIQCLTTGIKCQIVIEN